MKSLKKYRFTRLTDRHDPLLLSPSVDMSMNLGPNEVSGSEEAVVEGFLQKVRAIHELLGEMRQHMEQIKVNHRAMLTEPCTDSHQMLNEHALGKVRTIAFRINKDLKDLERDVENSPSELAQMRNTVTTHRIKTSQFNAVSAEFRSAIRVYHDLLEEYRTKSEDKVKRHLALAKDTFTDDEVEEIISNPDAQILTAQDLMSEPQLKEALGEIQMRNNELLSLQTALQELQEMVMAMAAMVDEQGEGVNRIEDHMRQAGDHVASGMRHAQAFNMYATRNRRVSGQSCPLCTIVCMCIQR